MNTTLTGFAALITVLLEVAKKAGWLPDTYGGKIAVIANALLLAGALVSGQLGYDLSSYDKIASTVATLVTQLVVLFGVSWFTFKGLRVTGLSARPES